MGHYLYHMIFEPTSAWERFKFDSLGAAVSFATLGVVYLIFCLSKRRNP